MIRIGRYDLDFSGNGTATGLPGPLVGGMKLDSPEMPVCARGRSGTSMADLRLSYPLARGCVKLLDGELGDVEIVGHASGQSPAGVHLVLSNGTSHAWAAPDTDPQDSSLVLRLSGMPFSSQLVNYNLGVATGLFLLLHRESYPDFSSSVETAVDAWAGGNETRKAQAIAVMADEMALALEKMMEGKDPLGLSAIVMDREKPDGYDATVDGGELLRDAFTSIDGFKQYAATAPTTAPAAVVQDDSTEVTAPAISFVGDLPVKLIDCIQRGKHVLLTGPTATGKTLAVEEVCLQLGAPLTVVRGSEGLEDRDLIGSTIIETEKSDGQVASRTRFTYGPIPEAMILGRRQYELHLQEMENARLEGREPMKIPPSVLLIDEINRLQLRFQNFILSTMNVRKATQDYFLRIPDNNEEIACPDGFLVIIAARNVGTAFAGVNPMDLALERRFYKKVTVEYLPPEAETALVISRTGLDPDLTKVLVKVASDTRYQLSQLKAPMDTGTLLSWAEELAYLQRREEQVTQQTVLDVARDIAFDIVLERSERGGFDPAGEAILTDNINENWRDVVVH